ncbi:MAG: DNA ligase D [Candidatus Acidiferrales bacterium]
MALLQEYRRKRKFRETPEPSGKVARHAGNHFVVQEHHARRLHYDFRLEVDGVLKSWAVPKGPSLNPADKRLAVQTEDHPLDYGTFEGTIPAGHYGAGEVAIWDSGTFEPEGSMSASEQINRGEIKFKLYGQKLKGSFVLVRLRGDGQKKNWLLIKHRDAAADMSGAPGKVAEPMLPETSAGKKSDKLKMPEGAQPAPMPTKFQAALATLAENPSSDPSWLFEIKWDGIRALACVKDGKLKLLSRTNRDITREYPDLSVIANSINAKEACIDGEIVALDSDGRSDFQRLQNRMGVQNPSARSMEEIPVVYYAFDVIYCDGHDLRNVPLVERKEFLKHMLRAGSVVRYSDHQIGKGKELFELALKRELEGIVGKQVSGAYPAGRTTAWLKFKTDKEVDAVVGGWTEPRGTREYFGALLLGLYDGDKLRLIGGAGTGFSVELQKRLWARLQSLKSDNCPFDERPSTREKATWLKPEMVARVKFGGWTEGTHLRQPRFLGLQEDRNPRECTLEKEMKQPVDQEKETKRQGATKTSSRMAAKSAQISGRSREVSGERAEEELTSGVGEELFAEVDGRELRLTNLNKLYFPEDGITKRNLLAYYYRMAPLMVPFLRDRPLVLRRYPNGIAGEAFFQKDADKNTPNWVKTAPIVSEGKGKKIHYFIANDRATLLYLTNLGCIDHNPWSSRAGSVENPDYIFFDLDPTDGTPFTTVVKVAKILMGILEKAEMAVFAKTSGATGIHIFLPVEPRYTYEQARTFVQAVSALVDAKHPGLLTFERSVAKRPSGRILIDAHQNSEAQSLASVYSVRAFPHAPVSTPVRANELDSRLLGAKWSLKSLDRRLEKTGDLWANFWKQRQELEPAVKLLERMR